MPYGSNAIVGSNPTSTTIVIKALGIPLVGEVAAQTLAGHFQSLRAMLERSPRELEEELSERSVGFRIDDEDLEDLKTVRDAVDYVVGRL